MQLEREQTYAEVRYKTACMSLQFTVIPLWLAVCLSVSLCLSLSLFVSLSFFLSIADSRALSLLAGCPKGPLDIGKRMSTPPKKKAQDQGSKLAYAVKHYSGKFRSHTFGLQGKLSGGS